MLIFSIDELESGIGDIDESFFCHTKQSNLIGRTEAILESSEDTIILVLAPLEEKNGVDQVFEDLGSRDGPLLGHMSDEDDRTSGSFGELHEDLGHISDLSDTPRTGSNIE